MVAQPFPVFTRSIYLKSMELIGNTLHHVFREVWFVIHNMEIEPQLLVNGGFHLIKTTSNLNLTLADDRFLLGHLLVTAFILFTQALMDADEFLVILILASKNGVFTVDFADLVHHRIHVTNVFTGFLYSIRRKTTLGKVQKERRRHIPDGLYWRQTLAQRGRSAP